MFTFSNLIDLAIRRLDRQDGRVSIGGILLAVIIVAIIIVASLIALIVPNN